ncbi:MAG: CHAD domain-containing protein [Chitinivibrionales bacterium]|nr:CHAD domain-containing protein [Chitinivibrionales bacterium]MBD3358387.1 CHAD domain-containing protein [Chitinivibrionales bacterium]
MSMALAVKELRIQYGDERTHTDQVTNMARVLFDRTHRVLAIPKEERRLLEASCRLHDVGYRLDPPNHGWMGAQLILTRGLEGFTDDERAVVAGTVLLHRRKFEHAAANAFIQNLNSRERAYRLAAYLRIADGLDHSHIQDATISSVRRRNDTFVVSVHSGWYGGNASRADVKADLWRKVFPTGISFRGMVPEERGAAFENVIIPGETILRNVQRLLFALRRTVIDCREQMLLSEDPRALHDLRVAVRRFRAALAFCGPLLNGMALPERLDSYLAGLLHGLGSPRDADVWNAFLRKPKVVETMPDKAVWNTYVAQEWERRERKAQKLKAILRSDEWRRTIHACSWTARVLFPQRIRDTRDTIPAEAHAASMLREEMKQIMKRSSLAEATDNDKQLHALRRAVRKGRYWAEFAHPLSDEIFGELVRRLHAVTHALGELHDTYVFKKRMSKSKVEVPAELDAMVRKHRKRWVKSFREEWAALSDEKKRDEIERKLNETAMGH